MSITKYHLVSLGSSFAAGPGLIPHTSGSQSNYPTFLSHLLPSTLSNNSISGSTLLDILSTSQTSLPSALTSKPQVEGVTGDADFVTITSGGNDFGYIGGMMQDAFAGSKGVVKGLVRWALSWRTKDAIDNPDEDEIVRRMDNVILAIRQRAPKATVLLVEYLTLIGPDAQPNSPESPFTRDQLEKYKDQAKMLQRIYAKAAAGKEWVRLIHIAEESMGHGLGSEDPWVSGFSLGMLYGGEVAFHPNKRGMEMVARIIYQDLKDAGFV
jgi:lysophospholipase L1-like esterase